MGIQVIRAVAKRSQSTPAMAMRPSRLTSAIFSVRISGGWQDQGWPRTVIGRGQILLAGGRAYSASRPRPVAAKRLHAGCLICAVSDSDFGLARNDFADTFSGRALTSEATMRAGSAWPELDGELRK